jgi:hypothetical protein
LTCVDDTSFKHIDISKTCDWYSKNVCKPSNIDAEGNLKMHVAKHLGPTNGSPEKKCCACDGEFPYKDYSKQEVAPSTKPGTCTHKADSKDVLAIIALCKSGSKHTCGKDDRKDLCQWIPYTKSVLPAVPTLLLKGR